MPSVFWRDLYGPRWLQMTRAEQRERRARPALRPAPNGNLHPATDHRCLYCRGPLANGRAVCSDKCDMGWWWVVPTVDGELWTENLQ
jgi:hypothetical protein